MNTLQAENFVKHLRSGEYRQIVGNFEDGSGGYCALGLLCISNGIPAHYVRDGGLPCGVDNYTGIEKHLGLTDGEIQIIYEMNDQGKSFDEIADYIEATYIRE